MDDLTPIQREVIDNWDPEYRPEHCSNCLNAKVRTEEPTRYRGPDLAVYCAKGHGKRISLSYWALMRRKHPIGFKRPRECEDWSPMDDQ